MKNNSSADANYSTSYVYGQDGQRSNKYTQNSETLYFNKMWTLHTDSGNSVYGGQTAKNIYLGETRIVTKLNGANDPTYQEEYYKQYFYHSDHLGSASLISDYNGDEYQRIEYTPYGETWVEKTSNTGMEYLPYKFTAKELDEETGLYYYGARYLDPKYSMWISTDPALGEYIPIAPTNDEAKRHNSNLPGMGGVFNHINFNLYHYAGNSPVKYTDPDGRVTIEKYYLTDFLAFQKSSIDMLAVPIGGGLTDSQKDVSNLSSAVSFAMGLIPTVGSYAGIFSNDISVSTLRDTVLTISGMISDSVGSVLSIVDVTKLICSKPELAANNYTESQKEYLAMCGIEQSFVKDFAKALNDNGIFADLNMEHGFVKNLHILATDVYEPEEQLKNIANQVKNSNAIYKNVQID